MLSPQLVGIVAHLDCKPLNLLVGSLNDFHSLKIKQLMITMPIDFQTLTLRDVSAAFLVGQKSYHPVLEMGHFSTLLATPAGIVADPAHFGRLYLKQLKVGQAMRTPGFCHNFLQSPAGILLYIPNHLSAYLPEQFGILP